MSNDRFSDLDKLVAQPAARLMAVHNFKFGEPVSSPAAADVPTVLLELDEANRPIDMLRLLAVSLPTREAVWWACLAGRDSLPTDARPPKTLTLAEKWSFEPTEENRVAVREALDHAEPGDRTMLCALAASVSDGTLGPGDLANHEAPPGMLATAVFGMNLLSLKQDKGNFFFRVQVLIERGLDIARGGNGEVDLDKIVAKGPAVGMEDGGTDRVPSGDTQVADQNREEEPS